MSQQSSITSFFKPAAAAKRKQSDRLLDNNNIQVKTSKKVKSLLSIEVIELLQHLDKEDDKSKKCWHKSLDHFIHSNKFENLAKFVASERKSKVIFPPVEETFSAFNFVPLQDVKVVVIGQDPYHGVGQGHGLAFSVKKGVKIPPSLKNIYKELYSNNFLSEGSNSGSLNNLPSHGYLEHWAKQGVLMLNSVLTVRSGQAFSHSKKGWEEFTDEVVKILNKECEGLVFLLWGKPAAEKGKVISRTKHRVISTSHPSPLGATKTKTPFIGSKCFIHANQYLKKRGKDVIDWAIPN